MDNITSLARTVVATLAPYLGKTGQELAKETGKATASKIGKLYQALKTRFKNTPTVNEALAELEAHPDDEDAQAVLRNQLRKQMNADSTLIDMLQKLLDEINHDKGSYSFLTQVYGGKVDKIFNIGYADDMGSSRLAGDTTTDAPPPDVKKKRKGTGTLRIN
jgi:hypothetical protein